MRPCKAAPLAAPPGDERRGVRATSMPQPAGGAAFHRIAASLEASPGNERREARCNLQPTGSEGFERITGWVDALARHPHAAPALQAGRLLANAALVVVALRQLATPAGDGMALRARLRLALQALESAMLMAPAGEIRDAAARMLAAIAPPAARGDVGHAAAPALQAACDTFVALCAAVEAGHPELPRIGGALLPSPVDPPARDRPAHRRARR